jgi:hypothetical protein
VVFIVLHRLRITGRSSDRSAARTRHHAAETSENKPLSDRSE